MDMALEMLRVAEKNRTSDVVLTPHHLNGVYENDANTIKEHFLSLQQAAKNAKINVTLHLGCEVHLTHETVKQLIEEKALTYAGLGKAALIELPKHSIPVGATNAFKQLIEHGITPIIAHPERNSAIRNDINLLKSFIDLGCKSQLTAMSCTGDFGPELQTICQTMISKGYAHLIASDAHRPDVRSPDLSRVAEYIEKKFDADLRQILLYENPINLLYGEQLVPIHFEKKFMLF